MRTLSLGMLLVAGIGLAACGGSTTTVMDMSPEDGNTHTQTGCSSNTDCDDGNKCHVNTCVQSATDPTLKSCQKKDKVCPNDDDCNVGMCDATDGSCGQTATNEGGTCTASDGSTGSCQTGTCSPLPSCYASGSFSSLACGTGYDGSIDDTNDPNQGQPTQNTANYACAKDETAPEVAYTFAVNVDEDVSITLDPTDQLGAMGPDFDLDLIILDTTCTESAACLNTQTGSTYQGITAGTGHERLTFHALAAHQYYIVVDCKANAIGSYHLAIVACGVCQPSVSNTLSCNMSTPVSGDTSQGVSNFDSYTCASGNSTVNVSSTGKEQAFYFHDDASVTRKLRAKVTSANHPVNVMALPVGGSTGDHAGECDPTQCLGTAASSGGAASFDFTAAIDYGPSDFWVLVDAPNATDATYGLELDCLPYCSYQEFGSQDLDCTNKTADSAANNGGSGSTNVNTAWGPSGSPCDSGLAGPEFVYLFTKPNGAAKSYKFSLTATTAGKKLHLVVLDAGSSAPTSCDPTVTCAATGAHTSTGPSTETNITVSAPAGNHYYWVIVDGETATDISDYALEVVTGC